MARCLLYLSLRKLHLSSCCLFVYITMPTLPMSDVSQAQNGRDMCLSQFQRRPRVQANSLREWCKQVYPPGFWKKQNQEDIWWSWSVQIDALTPCSSGGTMYTGGKDCAVIRWDVETGKKAGGSIPLHWFASPRVVGSQIFFSSKATFRTFSNPYRLTTSYNLCSRPIWLTAHCMVCKSLGHPKNPRRTVKGRHRYNQSTMSGHLPGWPQSLWMRRALREGSLWGKRGHGSFIGLTAPQQHCLQCCQLLLTCLPRAWYSLSICGLTGVEPLLAGAAGLVGLCWCWPSGMILKNVVNQRSLLLTLPYDKFWHKFC